MTQEKKDFIEEAQKTAYNEKMQVFKEEAKKRELDGSTENVDQKADREKNEETEAKNAAQEAADKAEQDFKDEEVYKGLPENLKKSIDRYIQALVKERVDE